MRSTSTCLARSRQQGAVLYIALILLLILTIIGVAAARLQTGEAVMARNDHNHQLAMQAAEAALRARGRGECTECDRHQHDIRAFPGHWIDCPVISSSPAGP